MSGRCCCSCCSLSTGSSVALVFATVEAVLSILINTELLLLISESDLIYNPSHLVINIDTVEDFDVFHGIVLAALGLNAFWLAFAIFAITGNLSQSHARLTPWIFTTYLLSMFQFGLTVYFTVKFQSSFSETQEFYKDSIPTKTLTYLALLTIYSGGGILLILNLCFAHIVERRGKEIDHDYAALVLYILSHMSRCSHTNDGMQQQLLPEAPPMYEAECPPYLPPQIYQIANESSGSSWSVSCGANEQPTNASGANRIRSSLFTPEEIEAYVNTNVTNCYSTMNV